MSFSAGEMVFVLKSVLPAKVVRMVDATTVEVEWPDSQGTAWERFYPIDTIERMAGSRRQRKKPEFLTSPVKDDDATSARNKKRRTSVEGGGPNKNIKVETKKGSTRRNGATYNASPNRPFQPRKLSIVKTEPSLALSRANVAGAAQSHVASTNQSAKEPHKHSKRKTAFKSTPAKRNALSPSLARMPPTKTLVLCASTSSGGDSSDDEILAQHAAAKKVLPTSDDQTFKTTKFGAVAADMHTQYDYASSSDDELDLIRSRSKRAGCHTSSSSSIRNGSSNSDNDDRKPAFRPRGAHQKLAVDESSSEESGDLLHHDEPMRGSLAATSFGESENSDSSDFRNDDKDSSDGSRGQSVKVPESVTSHGAVKTESNAMAPSRPFMIGDHIYGRDGPKGHEYPAVIVNIVNDSLEVKWADRRGTYVIAKTAASLMFDLTKSNDSGRPRRCTRTKTQTQSIVSVATPVKAAPVRRRKVTHKEEHASATRGRTKKNWRRQQRKKTPVIVAPKKKKAVVMVDVSVESNENKVIDSSDSDSDAESVVTEATFEFTAPTVDPMYQSVHVITRLEDFMAVEPWKKQVIRVQQSYCERGGARKPPPAPSLVDCSINRSEQGNAYSIDWSSNRLEEVKELRPESNCDTTDGRSCLPYASLPTVAEANALELGMSSDDENRSHRQSAETENVDDLPDSPLSEKKMEATNANEGRLTADSTELSQTFELFSQSRVGTQAELTYIHI